MIGKKVLTKIVLLLIVLFGVTILTFVYTNLSPVDAAEALAVRRYSRPTAEQIELVREELGLDKPILQQYGSWLWNALHGDFGNSYNTGRSIVEELVASIQPTLIMAVLALLFSTVICIPLGVLSASRKGGLADKSIYLFGIICMSLPNYWIGFMLLLAFAVYLPIFSIMGADSLKDFVLPALALAIPTSAGTIRVFRSSLLDGSRSVHFICRGWIQFIRGGPARPLCSKGGIMMLTVSNLSICTKRTKEVLVHSVSFSVGNGETLGLIGESGSGKSMTSKCIMKLLNPRLFDQTGSIQWNGREMLTVKMSELRDYRGRQISMIPQNPMTAFAPMLKLGKQVEMGFSLKGQTEKMAFRKRFAAALADVNLPDARKILGSYPHELSGGTLQRVMIALTLLQRPKLIIADEITTAVDAASEYLILNELEKLKKSGVSMIVVTHDFGVAAKICDRVAVMKNGEIIETGKTKDVFTKPQHEYTRQLVQASVLFQEGLC